MIVNGTKKSKMNNINFAAMQFCVKAKFYNGWNLNDIN